MNPRGSQGAIHIGKAVPEPRVRSAAAAIHVGTVFFPVIAPVVALVFFGREDFVRAHAWRSLAEAILIQAVVVVVGAISLTYTALILWNHYQTGWHNFSPWPFVTRMALGWIALSLLEVVNAVSAFRAARRAYRGEWPRVQVR